MVSALIVKKFQINFNKVWYVLLLLLHCLLVTPLNFFLLQNRLGINIHVV